MQQRIRPATTDEMPTVAALRWAWSAERAGARPVVDRESFTEAFTAWASRHAGSHRCVVAEVDGSLVGMAWLALVPRVPSPRSPDRWTGELQSVYVLPAHRGRGLGAELVRAVVAAARHEGAERLVVHSSERAVPLYAREGFVSSELLRDLALPS